MNKKGFTLVELLVTIAILGVITGLSIPIIRNIQTKQVNKKYETYMKSLVSGAKLYTDSYSIDMFDENLFCDTISYEELKKRNLIKDIDIPDVSCDSEYTIVKVQKYKDKYFYKGFLGCGQAEKPKKPTETNIFKPEKLDLENVCVGGRLSGIGFSTTVKEENYDSNQFQSRNNLRVLLLSDTGINIDPKPRVLYTFISDPNAVDSVNDWKELSYESLPSLSDQEYDIQHLITVTIRSKKIPTPPKVTGEFYLALKIISLTDLEGSNWSNGSSNYYVFPKPFKFDNSGPTYNPKENDHKWLVSSEPLYNHKRPKLNLTGVVEDTYSDESEIRYCYSYDNDTCDSPKKRDDEIHKSYTVLKGKADAILEKISDAQDGSTHRVYLTLLDNALNKTKLEMDYRVSKEYNLTYDSAGGSSCDSSKQIEGNKFTNLCKPSKTGYTFGGWYTEVDGKGTLINADSIVPSKDLKLYAKWTINTYTVSYNGNGNTSGSTAATKCTYGQKITTATNGFAKTGHTFNGWIDVPTTCTGDVTVKASWKANTYTITYAGNGHTSGSTAASTCTYGQAISPRANGFKKNHYTFNGWSGTGTCTGNKTLTAQWRVNVAKLRYNTGVGSGAVVITNNGQKFTIKDKLAIYKNGVREFQKVSYNNKVNLYNYHYKQGLYVYKSKGSTATAVSKKEWTKCSGTNYCVQTYYDQTVDYPASKICNTINGDCWCCVKVNWK